MADTKNITENAELEAEQVSPIAIPGTDITEEKLAELKKEYKKVFASAYASKIYVWHRLNRKAFSEICDATAEIEDDDELLATREKEFCKACILYPPAEEVEKDMEDEVISSHMAREILFRSGFYQPQTTEL